MTDSGIEGVGEVYAATFNPFTIEHMIRDVCEHHVIGADPFKIEAMWRNVYGRGYSLRPDISLMGVLSGIEIACWDIIGKELDRPIYDLLGGRVRDRIRSYTYLYPQEGDTRDIYTDPDLAAERAAEYVARGFTAVKFDPVGRYTAYDPRQLSRPILSRSEAFVRKIREAVGDRADIILGTHGQMTAAGAIRLARTLEPYDPLCFEEPVPPENEYEMAKVARAISIPVPTG
ncbi:MAG: mandelate racemase/muconate lactonizing enzyme family protein, partial [Rhodospirillales bacterium]